MARRLSIKSIGVHLPEERRQNEWWPKDIVESWRVRRQQNPFRGRQASEGDETPGVRLALEAMSALEGDLFGGTRERPVRKDGVRPSVMELAACREAIARAGIAPDDIGMVLSTSQGPDTLLVANAALLHRELGLPRTCISTGIDGVCNGFALQLAFAEPFITTGRVRYALLVQSSAVRSLFPTEHPLSPLFGDAATAVVVGAGDDAGVFGMLASHHITDGSQYDSLLIGNPSGEWFTAAPEVYTGDKPTSRKVALQLPDIISGTVRAALDAAGLRGRDVDFIATHQGAGWIRRAVQELVGAEQARSHDTFPFTGTVGPANAPLCLALAERAGELRRGDIVALGTGGAGATVAGTILRWESESKEN